MCQDSTVSQRGALQSAPTCRLIRSRSLPQAAGGKLHSEAPPERDQGTSISALDCWRKHNGEVKEGSAHRVFWAPGKMSVTIYTCADQKQHPRVASCDVCSQSPSRESLGMGIFISSLCTAPWGRGEGPRFITASLFAPVLWDSAVPAPLAFRARGFGDPWQQPWKLACQRGSLILSLLREKLESGGAPS